MKKTRNKLIITTLGLIVATLIGAFSCTLTWFAKLNSMNLDIGGSVLSEYFDSGDGTQENPFVITRPKHWENLVWLHNNVSNFYQAIADGSDPEASFSNEKGYYFQVGKVNPEAEEGDTSLYVYDYTDEGLINPSNNKLTSRTLNLNGLGSLIPIGSSSKPFVGELISDGITISGFDVLGFEDRNNNLVQDTGEQGFNDVGIFGYIGKQSLISGLYFDDFIVHLANSDVNGAGTNNSLHNTQFHDTDGNGVLDEIYVGYIAGHIHFSSTVTNVYINNCKMDGGSAALSGFSYFGIAENEDGTPKPTPMEEIKATKLAGEGNSFGGSIDFYNVYDRLARIYSSSPNETQTYYVSAETLVNNSVSGDKFTYSQTKTYAAPWGSFNSANVGYRYYQSETGGSFNISTQSDEFGNNPANTNIYQCLYGESLLHYTKTVTTYTYIDDWYSCFFIQCGDNYFNSRYYSDIRNVTDSSEAAGWNFDASNHLYTKVFDETYYLVKNGGALELSKTASTTWTKSNDDDIYTVVNGVNYYLNYQNGWCISANKDRFNIYDGQSNYLCASDSSIYNTTDPTQATNFFSTTPNGSSTMFGFNVGNQTYYISVVNSQLGVSTTECTWYIEDGHYYTLLDGIALYIVFENNEWHLTPADGVMLSVNSMHLNVQNSVYNADGGTIWQFSSLTGDTQISCVYNNAKYYLTCEDGVVKVTTTPTTWHRNGEALYITIGEQDYYLTYDSGWKATALDYYLIHDATSTNYLVVSGTQSFTNTTNSAEATHFYFSNTSGDHPYGSLSCIFNGSVQYLQIYFDTVNRIGMLQLESQPTPFSNDGTSLYYAGSGVSYYLEYEGDWHIRTYMDGYYISDGKDYMTVSGTTVGNTTNKYNATIFTFSSTGTNPSGYVSVCGTSNYLRYSSGSLRVTNNTTSNRTSLSNDGNNLYYSSRYLTCVNGTWGFNTSTNCSAYTIQRDGYYLCCSTTGQIYTSTTDKTYWSGVSGRIRDRSTGYYLCFNNFSGELGNLITSTSSSATNGNWSSTDGSNGGKIIYIINSTQAKAFAVDLRDGQFYVSATAQADSGYTVPSTTVVTATSTRCPSKAIKTSNDIVAVGQTEYEIPMPTVYVENYSMTNNFHISDPKPIEYNLNFFNTRLQNCEKEIRNNVKSGNPTYFPLRVDKDESGNYPSGYAVSEKNTGYLISGANLETSSTVTGGQDTVGDIRVAGWPVSNISASYNSTSKAFTKIYTVDGTSSNTIRELTTAEKQDAGYVEALSQFGTTLSQSGGKVYGVHFMDAAISTSHTVRANQATILGKTYYNYELPEDSIDFNVYQKGKISFFAGEYFTNNNTFFSLHRIFRDANNDIDEIKEIVEIYDHAQKHDKANYIYKFSDGTYTNANGSYTGSRTKDSMYSTNPVFKTSWITNPSGLSTSSKRLFYFSIPCNAGEYALGSVSGKNGAYLCYLDIATNGGDTKLEEMKTTETATTFNVDYRSPDVVTNHSILQLGGEIPAAVNPEDFSITVNFDNSAETCDGKEYASGIYTIYVVNKTDEEFELCVLVIDDNDDLYDDFYYAYRVIYTNKDNTEEIIMCTPLNDPGGDAKDYWQRLAIFEIPPDGEAHESDYTE